MRQVLPLVLVTVLITTLGVSLEAFDPPRPVLVLDNHDQPWAAWVERRGKVTVGQVARWDRNAWVSVGSPLNRNPEQSVASVSLAFGPDGSAWAAWGERPFTATGTEGDEGRLHVAKWSGKSWDEPAPLPIHTAGTVVENQEIRIDSKGTPWILWSEIPAGFQSDNIYLAVLKDKTWSLVDDSTLTTDISSSSRSHELALGPDGRPYLAYSEMVYHHDFEVYFSSWDGAHWAPIHGSLNLDPENYASFVSVVLDSQGVPTVAFLQASDGFKLAVRRFNGKSWDLLGTPGSLGARNPKVALSLGGAPVLAAVERIVGITVRQRSNAGWVDLGSVISTPGAFVDTLDLAVDTQGDPWVIWTEDDQNGQRLGLSHWTGRSWEALTPPPFSPR